MTKISQITGVSISIVDSDKIEKERADGVSEQATALQLKNYIVNEVPYLIFRSTGPDGHRWKMTIGDDGMPVFPLEDLGV